MLTFFDRCQILLERVLQASNVSKLKLDSWLVTQEPRSFLLKPIQMVEAVFTNSLVCKIQVLLLALQVLGPLLGLFDELAPFQVELAPTYSLLNTQENDDNQVD